MTAEKPFNQTAPIASPLAELAKAISAIGKHGLTPVIVCGRSITLADDFYVALCTAVRARSGCGVRLDLLPGHRLSGILSIAWRKRHLHRLSTRLAGIGTVGSTIALSRTDQPTSEIVIGFAGPKDELPPYAKSIDLAA